MSYLIYLPVCIEPDREAIRENNPPLVYKSPPDTGASL